jgi:hypothetical protein
MAPSARPEDAGPPLRYSMKRPDKGGLAYAVAAFCAVMGAGGIYFSVAGYLRYGKSPGYLAGDAAVALFCIALYGYGAALVLATTRPWWAREVRGSVYLDHRMYGRRKRYDLAAVTRAWMTVTVSHRDETAMYWICLYIELPDGRHRRIRVYFGRKGRDARLVLALADALAEHPDPAVVSQTVAELRWCATASNRDLHKLLRSRPSHPQW